MPTLVVIDKSGRLISNNGRFDVQSLEGRLDPKSVVRKWKNA